MSDRSERNPGLKMQNILKVHLLSQLELALLYAPQIATSDTANK